ncbi:MAG: hypothetical protein ACRD2L_02895 [Terriglobia bacterium]
MLPTNSIPLFPHFTWAVPLAFADALGACQFSRGDTLYSDPIAYRAWDDEFYQFAQDLQGIKVLHPETKPSPPSVNLFKKNWEASVEIELYRPVSKSEARRVSTTQGRLYSLLWRGELSVLDCATPKPRVPHQSPYLLSHLKSVESSVRQIILELANNVTHAFLFPRDRCNPLLEGKYQKLVRGLGRTSDVRELDIPLLRLALPEMERVAPTINLKAFTFLDRDETSIRDALKNILYVPTTKRKTQRDQFRMQTHGFFCTVSNGK